MDFTTPSMSCNPSANKAARDDDEATPRVLMVVNPDMDDPAVISPLPRFFASGSVRTCNSTASSTRPVTCSTRERAYNGKRPNPRKGYNAMCDRVQEDTDGFELDVLALQATRPAVRQMRPRRRASCPAISRRVPRDNESIPQRPLGGVLDSASVIDAPLRRVHSAFSSTHTVRAYGEFFRISSVHQPSSSPPALKLASPTPSPPSIPHPTSSSRASRALAPITASALSGVLTTLCAWRFRTFYADFIPPTPNTCTAHAAALLCPLEDALRTIDWARTHRNLERQCKRHEAWKARGVRSLAPLLAMVDAHTYNAARKASKMTGIPLRQVRRVVEAYAFWDARRGKHSDAESDAHGLDRTLTHAHLAARKEWAGLARLLLEDMEDLRLGGTGWVKGVLGMELEGLRMGDAVERCRESFFVFLEYKEGVKGEKKKKRKKRKKRKEMGWKRVRETGRLVKGWGNEGGGIGKAWVWEVEEEEEEEKEEPSSPSRAIEWSLGLQERNSMDGEEELLREIHERFRRLGIPEAKLVQERFTLD